MEGVGVLGELLAQLVVLLLPALLLLQLQLPFLRTEGGRGVSSPPPFTDRLEAQPLTGRSQH